MKELLNKVVEEVMGGGLSELMRKKAKELLELLESSWVADRQHFDV